MNLLANRLKLTLGTVLIAPAACVWYLLDSGFCFSQMRYLSDKELIVEAIRYNANDMKIDGTDASIETFLKQNPKCCSVDRHPSTRNFLDVCTGFNISEITLNYETRNTKPVIEPFYQVDISIGSCGEALKRKRGMSYPTLQQIH
jgi:hypothetical protein